MHKRPELNELKDKETFRDFYYLKDELKDYCKRNGLPSTGGKTELSDRIAYFLDTGQSLSPTKRANNSVKRCVTATDSALIGNNFVCSESAREYFRQKAGSGFTFNTKFQQWLKTNPDKTFAEAAREYEIINADRKSEKSIISPQFEYNAYIREFFADNSELSLNDAIKCWKFKKSQRGGNKYDKNDLTALEFHN